MKRKFLLIIVLLSLVIFVCTGCTNKKETDTENGITDIENVENVSNNTESNITENKAYTWFIKPTIEADDIIDLENREDVSLIKKGIKYNFINNDQGKELLRKDFFGYAALENGEINIWQEGGTPQKVNEDYTLEPSNYAGDYAPHTVYYNLDRKELFTQHHSYIEVTTEDEVFKNHKAVHGTVLEPFTEVTVTSFIDEEFDRYAEFSDSNLGKTGYYNTENLKLQIPAIYETALNFYEGVAAVKKDGKAGYIYESGEEVFEFEFEETRSFDNGRAWVKQDGNWGVIEIVKEN